MAISKVCLDVGHNQSSASAPGTGSEGRFAPVRLNVEEHHNITLTQIILTDSQMRLLHEKLSLVKSGKYGPIPTSDILAAVETQSGEEFKIGSSLALTPANGERFDNFKVMPANFSSPCGNSKTAKECSITCGIVMSCFIYALVRNIFTYNTDKLGNLSPSDTDLLVGCPTTSDWTSLKAVDAYADLVLRATGARSARIIPESRAAMFSSIEGSNRSISASSGAVVFDFGSSTADCTYMLLGRRIIEFSWTLGASFVEYNMIQAILEKARAQNPGFIPDKMKFNGVKDQMRRCKEAYFSGMYEGGVHKEICSLADDDTIVTVNKEFMDKATKEIPLRIRCNSIEPREGTWSELCRAFFEAARAEIEKSTYTVMDSEGNKRTLHCGVDTVVITGGASKMGFIEELCREVFPAPVKLVHGSDPSYTVSNGLAAVAFVDENRDACVAAAKEAVLSNGASKPEALYKAIYDSVLPELTKIFVKAANEWADDPEEKLPASDLERRVNDALSVPETQEFLRDTCARGIRQWKDELSSIIEEAVNSQVDKLYAEGASKSLIIPADVWTQLQASALNVEGFDAQSIISALDLTGLVTAVIKTVVDIVVWAVAWAMAGPTGGGSLVLALLYGIFTDNKDNDSKKPRKRKDRKRVAANIPAAFEDKKNREALMSQFSKSLNTTVENFDELIDETVARAIDIVTLRQFSL